VISTSVRCISCFQRHSRRSSLRHLPSSRICNRWSRRIRGKVRTSNLKEGACLLMLGCSSIDPGFLRLLDSRLHYHRTGQTHHLLRFIRHQIDLTLHLNPHRRWTGRIQYLSDLLDRYYHQNRQIIRTGRPFDQLPMAAQNQADYIADRQQ